MNTRALETDVGADARSDSNDVLGRETVAIRLELVGDPIREGFQKSVVAQCFGADAKAKSKAGRHLWNNARLESGHRSELKIPDASEVVNAQQKWNPNHDLRRDDRLAGVKIAAHLEERTCFKANAERVAIKSPRKKGPNSKRWPKREQLLADIRLEARDTIDEQTRAPFIAMLADKRWVNFADAAAFFGVRLPPREHSANAREVKFFGDAEIRALQLRVQPRGNALASFGRHGTHSIGTRRRRLLNLHTVEAPVVILSQADDAIHIAVERAFGPTVGRLSATTHDQHREKKNMNTRRHHRHVSHYADGRFRSASSAALFSLLAVILFWTTPAFASPQDLFGMGARMGALASTGVSNSDSWESVYSNPAGLARVHDKTLVLGFNLGGYAVKLDGETFALDPIAASTIGATLPIPFGGVLENRLVLGLGFFTPTGVMLSGQVGLARTPQFLVINRAQSTSINIGLAFDFHGWVPGLHVGAAVSALGSFAGSIVAGIDATGKFGSQVETQVIASYSPIVGAAYDWRDFSFGLVWRGKIESHFVFNIVTMDLPVTVPLLTIGGIAQFDPDIVSAEAAWRPVRDLNVALGVSYNAWSQYPGPLTQTSSSSMAPPNPHFKNTISPRISGEYTIRRRQMKLALRGGAAFDPTPAPPATATARYLDNDRLVLTAGFGVDYALNDHVGLTFDLFSHWSALLARTAAAPIDDTSTTNMRSTGSYFVTGWQAGLRW